MNQFYRLFLLVFLLFSVSSFATMNGKREAVTNGSSLEAHVPAPGDLTAAITGDAFFCAGSASTIVFEGSGGSAPYTFTYQVNGGVIQTANTSSLSSTVAVPVNASVAGEYTYRITSIKGSNGKATLVDISRVITIRPAPVVDFSFTGTACSGAPVSFISSVSGSGTYSYQWDFGDGQTSTEQNPAHAFSSTGCATASFTVSLTVTDENGCTATRSRSVTVLQKPDISFSDLNFHFGEPFSNCGSASASSPAYTVRVGNTSLSAGCITSYRIDWGDGSAPVVNASFPASHTYATLGAFEMVITAYGTNGCSNAITYVVRNMNNPSVGITSPGTTTNLCAPTLPLEFEIAKWGTNASGTTYRVDYGDGTPVLTLTQEQMEASEYFNHANPSASLNYPIPHSYILPNCPREYYIVRLIATNACSSTEATVNNITVFSKSVPDFTVPTHACVNSSVVLTNTSIAGYNTSCSQTSLYTWDFGDGTAPEETTSTLPGNTSHTYTTPGQYTVSLTTRNICGQSTASRVITIDPPLTAIVTGTGMVSGTINVCQGAPMPVITFTGTNGTAPYTFTYRINGGPVQTITTPEGSNSVTISVPTAAAGSFTYSLVDISDDSPTACTQTQTGTVKVVVSAPPTGSISGNVSACIEDASPVITFTGSGGTKPYTFIYTIDGGTPLTIQTVGSSNSASVIVPTSASGVVVYQLIGVQDAGPAGCAGVVSGSATARATIYPKPTSMTLSDFDYCNGEVTPAISFNNAVPGTSYRWTNSNPSIGLAALGTGSIPSFTARNSTGAPVTATITVIPSVNGCDGASQTFVITIYPSAVLFSQGAQTICSGDQTAQVSLSSPAGAAISWNATVPAGITGAVTSGTNIIPVQTLVNTTSAPLTVTYTATAALPADDPCAGTQYSYTITVNPRPDIRQVFTTEICSKSAFTVTPQGNAENSLPSGTKYTWSAPVISPSGAITGASAQATPQGSISQTLVNTTSSAATVTYTVIPVANGCAGNPFTVVVTVLPLPTAAIAGDATVCKDAPAPSVTFTGAGGTAPYTFSYKINGGAVKTITTTSGNSVSIPVATDIAGSFIYTLVSVQDKAGVGCMQAQSGSVTIVVSAPPWAAIAGSTTVCLNDASPVITFTGSGGTRPYTFTYTINGGVVKTITTDATSSSKTLDISTTSAGNYLYHLVGVQDAIGCSRTLDATVAVTVNELPAAMNLADATYCNGETAGEITFGNSAGTTYRWSSSNPSIGLPASGTGNIPSFTALNGSSSDISSTITVIPSLNGCDGAGQSFVITVRPSPIVTFSTGSQIICTEENTQAVTLSSSTAGVQFSWTAVQLAGITGVITSGTNTIPVQTLVNSTDAPITITYKAKATTSGTLACTGSEASYSITVNPRPSVTQTFAVEICSKSAFTVTPQGSAENSLPLGTLYTWSAPVISPSGAVTGASAQATPQGSISQTLVNTTSSAATVTYTVTPVANGCTGNPFTVVVTVLPEPKVNPLNDLTLCQGDQVEAFTFTGPVPGTVYQWTNSQTSTGIAGSGTDQFGPFTAVNTGSEPVQSTITVTPVFTNGTTTCEGEPMQWTVTVNPAPQLNAVQDVTACSSEPLTVGFTTQNTGGITSYEWTNSNTAIGLAASGSGSLSFVPVNTGNTSNSALITVTPVYLNNGVSCKGSAEVFTIIVEPKATVVQPQDQQVCNGQLTGNISFSGNRADAVYQWTIDDPAIGLPVSGPGTIAPFIAINKGTTPVVASITVTPVVNGCNGIPATFTLTVNPSPLIITQPTGSVVCLGDNPAALSVAVSGVGTPSYQWYSNTTASNLGGVSIPNANGASYDPPANVAGTVYYYCQITFSNDCNGLTSEAAAVTINPNPVISAIDQEISSGESFVVTPTWDNGNIIPTGTAYVWSDPVVSPAGAVSGATAQQVPQAVISQRLVNTLAQVATVTYTVFPVSGACTGASFKVTVYIDSPLTPHVTVIPTTCFGVNNGSIATDIQGGAPFAQGAPYTVLWTGPNGFSSTEASINNLAPGLYHLTVTDSRGKQISAEATISAPGELKVVTDEKKEVSCYGAADGRISISVEGGTPPYRTDWTKDTMPFAGMEDISGLAPGTYEVTVRDANGCSPRIMSWVIAQPDPLMIALKGKSDIHCYGDSSGFIAVEVTGGVPGYGYRWTGPAGFTSTDKDLSHLVAGDYHLLVTDGAGCIRSLEVTLAEPSPLAVSAQTTPISCFGANNATVRLNIIGGTPPYQAEWNNYATGTYQDNLSAGEYTILITDAAQCQISTTVSIPEAPVFRMNPEVKNVSCYGARDGSIALNFETTLKSVILIWSDNVRSGTTRNNIGPGVYTVNIQGGSLCMLNRTFVITEPAPLVLTAAVTDITDCNAASGGAIDLMVTGGTPPYRYAWSNGAVAEDLSNLQAGNYAITVTDAEGCAQVAQYTVRRPVAMVVDVSTAIVHDCASGIIKAVSTAKVSGGVAPYQLRWSTGTVSGMGNEQMETMQSGMVLLTVTDQSGCSVTRSFSIELPSPGIISDVTDCNGHAFQFNGVPADDAAANSYRWDFGDGTSSDLRNPQHTYQSPGTYQVLLTITAGGCTSVYREVVTAEMPPMVGIDKEPRFCPGDSVLVHSTGAISYRWNDGWTGDSRWISREGDYSVTGTSASGCQATYNFRASYYDRIGYTIQSDQEEVSQGASRIRFWSENIPYSAYHWEFGDGQSGQGMEVYHSYEISEDGYLDVTLKVINPNGCEEIATKRIWKSVTAIVNTFTPNGDGINDIYLKGWQIQVFNRNGILMYQGDEGWDGKHNGRPVDNDTYFVIIYDSTRLGAEYKKSYVTVLR